MTTERVAAALFHRILMSTITKNKGGRYILAFVFFIISVGSHYILAPRMSISPFVTFYPAIILAAFLCGGGPGLMVLILSATGGYFLDIGPQIAWRFDENAFVATAVFGVCGGITCIVFGHNWQLENGRALLASIVDSSEDAIASKTLDGIVTSWNPQAERLFGYQAHEIIGKPMTLIFPPDRLHEEDDFLARLARGESIKRYETVRVRKDGSLINISVNISPIFDHKRRVIGASKIAHDITQRKKDEEEIKRLAFYDSLTGLANRRLLLDRLKQALAANTRSNLKGALLFIDLDHFKTLNDTLGHDIGDYLLQQVARRLVTCVRESDTVARLGGDEFVVMLEDLSTSEAESAAQTEAVGSKIFAMLGQPFLLREHHHHIGASIGATLFSNHHDCVDDLLKRADLAMYRAKAAGRNCLKFFEPAMQVAMEARAALEKDMREGIRDNQFLLFYQPKVDHAGKITGCETLVRWQHPKRGLLPPGEFIPFAEDTGHILSLGHWIIEHACRTQRSWAEQADLAHLSLSINVSALQFHNPDFVDRVMVIFNATGADPRKIIFEVTESVVLAGLDDVVAKMTALKEVGISFSLDDFGTGYSSLSYLKRLPLDELKIDKSFVDGLPDDNDDLVIAKTIVGLASHLGLSVIAEGVEKREQRDVLVDINCMAFQGYLFGRPMPAEQFVALMMP